MMTINKLMKLASYSHCKQLMKIRACVTSAGARSNHDTTNVMKAWQICDFGGIGSVNMTDTVPKPMITHPDDVLIKVSAAGMNQIDRRMTEGYGRTVVSTLKTLDALSYGFSGSIDTDELPRILGRDCSGVVEAVGANVSSVQPGSEVYAAVPVERAGCHAEYVVTPASSLALKPPSLTHVQAAAIPYAALTAYTAIRKVGELSPGTKCSHALVIGASGGVGLYAIQLLRALHRDITVTATCNHDAVELLTSAGANIVIDYSKGDIWQQIRDTSNQYEFVLDLVGEQGHRATEILKPWSCSKYVTVVSPLLRDTDTYGLAGGLLKSAAAAGYDTLYGLQVGSSYRWAFFWPDGTALSEISSLIADGKFQPFIEQVYKFGDVKLAYERLKMKHLRGKLVIDVKDE